jgi:hypothetical protein
MRIWITKDAASKGIIEAEAEPSRFGGVIVLDSYGHRSYLGKNAYATDPEVARQMALEVIRKKRESIQRQLAKLDRIEGELKG